jgi:hypothetical protein
MALQLTSLSPEIEHRAAKQDRIDQMLAGMFGQQLMAGDPTLALLYLLQRICIRKGAGLDRLKERSKEKVG